MTRRAPLIFALIPVCLLLAADPGARADEPDAVAGRAVVVGGKESTVTPCFTCHGIQGVGDSAGAFPRLTGQVAFYLYKQLIDYASRDRPNDIMTPIARELTEDQMEDVAFYYSILEAPYFAPPEVDPEVLARGREIAEDGLEDEGLQACVFCHGAQGTGNPPLFPYLMGQYAPYTELQLLLWKRGVRENDPLSVMEEIAKKMSVEDIRAVALYFEWVRPPAAEGLARSAAETPPPDGAGE